MNSLDKDRLIEILLSMQEQIALMNTRAFARKSEKKLTDDDQLNFYDVILNEAEATRGEQSTAEPSLDTVLVGAHKRRKHKG